MFHSHIMLLASSNPAAAAAPLIGNIQGFIGTAGKWVTALGTPAGGLMVGYHALMRTFNEDPQAVAHHNQSMKKVAIGTGIVAASGVIAAIAATIL